MGIVLHNHPHNHPKKNVFLLLLLCSIRATLAGEKPNQCQPHAQCMMHTPSLGRPVEYVEMGQVPYELSK